MSLIPDNFHGSMCSLIPTANSRLDYSTDFLISHLGSDRNLRINLSKIIYGPPPSFSHFCSWKLHLSSFTVWKLWWYPWFLCCSHALFISIQSVSATLISSLWSHQRGPCLKAFLLALPSAGTVFSQISVWFPPFPFLESLLLGEDFLDQPIYNSNSSPSSAPHLYPNRHALTLALISCSLLYL